MNVEKMEEHKCGTNDETEKLMDCHGKKVLRFLGFTLTNDINTEENFFLKIKLKKTCLLCGQDVTYHLKTDIFLIVSIHLAGNDNGIKQRNFRTIKQ